ncbi:hypothetical protein [Natronomonas marina]|uniref:hypothetical protein n=1 Tax=Natronomonas marina TaxID=2961939 RepID=UPI0020C95F63|nr:hypothetical protein [Natronomonas marina]
MGYDTHDSDSRELADKKLMRAHQRVLAHWPEEAVKELDPLVIHDPMNKPDVVGDLEREFYEARHEALGSIELEPVSWAKPPVPHEASQFVDPRPVEWTTVVRKAD